MSNYNNFEHDDLATLSKKKQGYFSEKPTLCPRGSNRGRMHDWRGSQAIYQSATSSVPNTYLKNNVFIVTKLYSNCIYSTGQVFT